MGRTLYVASGQVASHGLAPALRPFDQVNIAGPVAVERGFDALDIVEEFSFRAFVIAARLASKSSAICACSICRRRRRSASCFLARASRARHDFQTA